MFQSWCICEGTGVMSVPTLDMYVICKSCKGVGTINEEESMDEVTETKEEPTFAYDEYKALQISYQDLRDNHWAQRSELSNVRRNVREWFQERYQDGDYDAQIVVEIDDINSLLRSINSSELAQLFEATATIELTISVHAESKEDAESIVSDHLNSISFDSGEDTDEYNVDAIDVQV